MSRLLDYLDHILEATHLAISYVDGMSREEFFADRRTQQAAIMNLLIIGEMANRLLQAHRTFLELYPEVQWQSMRGMRNRIAHGYFDINLEVVWDTLKLALPNLAGLLPSILESAKTGHGE